MPDQPREPGHHGAGFGQWGVRGNHVVSGAKEWISRGTYADWFNTAMRTGGKGAGIPMMLVRRGDKGETTFINSNYSSTAGAAFVTYEIAMVPIRNGTLPSLTTPPSLMPKSTQLEMVEQLNDMDTLRKYWECAIHRPQ